MNKLIIPGLAIGAVSVAIALSTGIAAGLTTHVAALAEAGFHKVNNHRMNSDKSNCNNTKSGK